MRVTKKDANAYSWYLKPFFYFQKKKFGQVLEAGLVWARSPKLFIAVGLLFGAIDRKNSPISPELRSLLLLRVSQLNDCDFCVDINAALLIQNSGSEKKAAALDAWPHSTLFSEEDKAALSYAEKITLSDQKPTDDTFENLKKHFDENAIVELTAIIAFQNMSSKFNSALSIPSQGFCKIKHKK